MGDRHHGNNNGVELEASYDYESDISLDWLSDTDVTVDIDIDFSIDSCPDVNDNVAMGSIDAQAFGDDTYTDFMLAVLTNDDYSSSVGWAISVTG